MVCLFETVDRRDVRMIQRREHFRLTLEARKPFEIARKRLGENLNRYPPLQLREGGPIDFPLCHRHQGRR